MQIGQKYLFTTAAGVLMFTVGSHLFINDMTINEDTETQQVEFLNWEENFAVFCSINKDIRFFTERVDYYGAAATFNRESLIFWNERLACLISAKSKIRKGIQLSTSTIKFFS
jgi:hypothetical protein